MFHKQSLTDDDTRDDGLSDPSKTCVGMILVSLFPLTTATTTQTWLRCFDNR